MAHFFRTTTPGAVKRTVAVPEPPDVLIECSRKGCPRKRRVPTDDLMPKGTARVVQACPWHHNSGDKTYSEVFFDTAGNELVWNGESDA